MELTVNGARTFCYTGGKPFDATRPTVVFLHGVLNDHSVWILQTRWFAHHGYSVLAPDLPGHARSEGEPPASVECEKVLTMSIAFCGSCSELSSRAGDTFIG